MLNIKKIRYPELNQIIRIYPEPMMILGKTIIWQCKVDGSNIGCYLDDSDNVHIRSRNMIDASEDMFNIFKSSDEYNNVKELLISLKYEYGHGQEHEGVIFGELLTKGKSPTKTEMHKKNEFVIFDIWLSSMNNFVNYTYTHQLAYQYDIPIVDLFGSSRHISMESLFEFRDRMLERAKKEGREGVVGKVYEHNERFMYFKEKLDLPLFDKEPRKMDIGKPRLLPLPESEIWGALDKVYVDIGKEKFMDKSIAMPLFAKYVNIEQDKHYCAKPIKKLFGYYMEKSEEIFQES